jgi:ElaB/YqjD/DUF883 family membrane-anchored ribosome-binding protein
MNPADKQGQNGTNGGGDLGASTTGTSGMQPTTPAMGASSSTADPMASGLGIDDSATRSGPDATESSASTGSAMGAAATGGSFNAGSTTGSGSMGGGSMGTSGTSGSGGGIKEQAREQATKLRSQATDKARTAAEEGKTRATETIDNLARAVHDAAGNLEQQVGPQVGQYAHRAADALDSLSESLRNKSVDELVDDARNFARRSPAIAIGAAVAVGFALARFLKATSSPSTGSYSASAYSLEDDDDLPAMTTTRTAGSTQPRYNA